MQVTKTESSCIYMLHKLKPEEINLSTHISMTAQAHLISWLHSLHLNLPLRPFALQTIIWSVSVLICAQTWQSQAPSNSITEQIPKACDQQAGWEQGKVSCALCRICISRSAQINITRSTKREVHLFPRSYSSYFSKETDDVELGSALLQPTQAQAVAHP